MGKEQELPPFPDELYEAYPAMSAQEHQAQVEAYVRSALKVARRRSSDEQAEVAGGEAMLAAVGALSELEDAILACQTLNDLVGLQAATQRRREADLATFNRGIALAQARLSARDEPISPELQAAIDHTKAEIRAAFSGVTPTPSVAKGGVTEEMVEAAARAIYAIEPYGSSIIGDVDWDEIDRYPQAELLRERAIACAREALTAALAVGDEGIREGENG